MSNASRQTCKNIEKVIVMDIHIIEQGFKIDTEILNVTRFLLTEEEHYKILKFRRWEDAQNSLIGKITVKMNYFKKMGLPFRAIPFQFNEYGKPFFKGKPFHFNISHTDKMVAIVFDEKPVGIDVECIRTIEMEMAQRFFSLEEYNDLMELKNRAQLEYFYDLWTLKESYVKAKGMGLSISLKSFTIFKDSSGFKVKDREKKYYLKQYKFNDRYKLSLCAMNTDFPSDINKISLDDWLEDVFMSLQTHG